MGCVGGAFLFLGLPPREGERAGRWELEACCDVGEVKGWALGEEAVAKQPEMWKTADRLASSAGGLALSSLVHGGISPLLLGPLLLTRSQGSQGHA